MKYIFIFDFGQKRESAMYTSKYKYRLRSVKGGVCMSQP